MLDSLFEKIEQWIRSLLTGAVTSNLTNLFDSINEKTIEVVNQVGQTPEGWNGSIFSMIRRLSDSVIIPIAGMIITFVLCYELITMITSSNNMHEIDTFMFFKYFFKMWVAVYIVSHTFDIVMAIFDVGQHLVNAASGIIGSTSLDISGILTQMDTLMKDMEIGELLLLTLETFLVSFSMKVISIVIMVITYGRMIEIYLYSSVSAVPLATMSNREWGQIGSNYLRGLIALAFQGFLMMVCIAIYSVLVSNMTIAANIHTAIFSVTAYTVLLCFALIKTGSLSKSIFNAH